MLGKPTLYLAIAAAVLASGCSDSGTGPPRQTDVVGVVTAIDDQTPVDGGITMTLRRDDGRKETLLFGSLFTYPPPDEAMMELYRKIREVVLGDRIRAFGVRGESGIGLTDLIILPPGR